MSDKQGITLRLASSESIKTCLSSSSNRPDSSEALILMMRILPSGRGAGVAAILEYEGGSAVGGGGDWIFGGMGILGGGGLENCGGGGAGGERNRGKFCGGGRGMNRG